MKTVKLFLFSALVLFSCAGLHAQVTMGGLSEPTVGALLDLNSPTGNRGGLLLSNVTIADLDSIPIGNPDIFPGITPATADINLELRGAMVYNDGRNPAVATGIYIWNGYCWTNDGRDNPSCLPAGTGTLKGQACFDVAETNDDIQSGNRAMRRAITTGTAKPADFSNPESNTQIYTFTPSGTASNIRFYAVENPQYDGKIVESLTPDGMDPNKVILVYKSNLNNTAGGKYNTEAMKVDIYAVYNDAPDGSGLDRNVKLTASIQDCQCCGAFTLDGQWLNFMCHNLGADGTRDPFTWVTGDATGGGGTLGYMYQWGRYSDGHQFRNSATAASGRPTVDEYNTAVSNYKSSATSINYNQSYAYKNTTYYDWVDDSPDTPAGKSRWGDGTTAANPAKAQNDPCPAGWKVPSQSQWVSIFRGVTSGTYNPAIATANEWKPAGTFGDPGTGGYKVGDALYLPAAGQRAGGGGVDYTGLLGRYWSSTWSNTAYSHFLYFNSSSVAFAGNHRTEGLSVRCVSE